jgi:hypothetical protein
MLSKQSIDHALATIKHDVKNFTISPKALTKFSDSKEDKRFYSYFNNSKDYYHKVLPLLITNLHLKNIVELGSREGISTLCMWDTLPEDAHLTTIDLIHDQRYCPDAMFTDPRVSFVFGDVCDLSIFGSDNSIPFDIDFLFSDTIHHAFQIRDEFAVYEHLLADRAIVAVDDVYVNDKHEFFKDIHYETWDLTELCHQSGWALFLFERKQPLTREERLLRAYTSSAKIWRRRTQEIEKIFEHKKNRTAIALIKRTIKAIPPLYKLLTTTYNALHGLFHQGYSYKHKI